MSKSETPATSGEAAKVDDGSIRIQLRKPIRIDGEPQSEIVLREPTGGDIARAGNPVIVDWSGDKPAITFDEKKMEAMLCTLSALPPSSIKAMHPNDWIRAAWSVAGFFVPDLGTGS